jgi:hypothetical protein
MTIMAGLFHQGDWKARRVCEGRRHGSVLRN